MAVAAEKRSAGSFLMPVDAADYAANSTAPCTSWIRADMRIAWIP